VGIHSGLEKIPAEPLFCDERSNAIGPCMRSDIHKEALSPLWIQRKPLPFELSRKVLFKVSQDYFFIQPAEPHHVVVIITDDPGPCDVATRLRNHAYLSTGSCWLK